MGKHDKKGRKLFRSVIQNIDASTGEVTERIEHFVKEVNRDEFIKFYTNHTGVLLELKDHELRLMIALFEYIDYDNVLMLPKERKIMIGRSLGKSLQRVSDTITSLVKKEALYRMHNGYYTVNPDIVFKGDDLKRIQLFKRIIEIKVNL